MRATVILLNGASSAGKTSIARELQRQSEQPLFHLQIDTFANMLPPDMRGRCLVEACGDCADKVAYAFHSAVAELALSGKLVVVDHVLGESDLWVDDFDNKTRGLSVVRVGVKCELDQLLERESSRTDRMGHKDVAERQFHEIHDGLSYDIEVDTSVCSASGCTRHILDYMDVMTPADICYKQPRASLKNGYVQVYTGDGKGKTTAAAGLAIRAAGAGLRVFIGQFIKSSDSHEMALIRKRCPEVIIEQFGDGRFVKGSPSVDDISGASYGIERLRRALCSGEYDVVIADEANGALNAGVIKECDLMSLVDVRKNGVELVITGRDARPELIRRADLVTEMQCIKHLFKKGVFAREGMEF